MTQEQFFARYKYDVEDDLLGGGGFGKVYKAFDDTLNRYVAIKVSELKKGQESLSLMKEVELAASLPHHKNVAHYEECFRYKFHIGTFDYGILQYYPLGNLSQLVRSKKLQEADRESIATGIISGIHHLHGHNVVHRDLKSANILIAEGYQGEYVPKIADFGLSKQFTENEKSYFSNSFAGGSLLYVAPEQLEGKELRKNVDLWSLGVVLYELFVGETPFKASVDDGSETARAEIISKIKNASIPAAISTVPSGWQEVIRGCLVTDPTRRTKSIEDILSKVGMVSIGTSDTVVEPDPPNPKPTSLSVPKSTSVSVPKWVYYLLGGVTLAIAVMLGVRSCGGGEEITTGLVVYQEGNMYGYKDVTGNIVIPARYETANLFSDGRAKVTVADSVYYIDEFGSIVEMVKPKTEIPADGPRPEDKAAKDESAWQQATRTNTKASYEKYLDDFPSGRYVSEARAKIRDIDQATQTEAERKRDEIAWQQAKSSNTKELYERYIRENPNGKYVNEAHGKIQEIVAAEQKSQENIKDENSEKIYKVVEQMPRFTGCEDKGTEVEKSNCSKIKLLEYINTNLKYPANAQANRIEGQVILQFVVEKNGTTSNVNIIRDIGGGCGEAAVDLIRGMNKNGPKWTPGKQNGVAIRVSYVIPIKFSL
jgi:TonB family protein